MKTIRQLALIFYLFQMGFAQGQSEENKLIDRLFIEGNVGYERMYYLQRNNPDPYIYENRTGFRLLSEILICYRNTNFNIGLGTSILAIKDLRLKTSFNLLNSENIYLGPFQTYSNISEVENFTSGLKDSHTFGIESYFHGAHVEVGYSMYRTKYDNTYSKNVSGIYFKVGYAFRLGILKKK